jgi:hypothetical protein
LVKFILTKVTAILPRNPAKPPCLGHLGQHDMNRTNPVCVILPKVAKANSHRCLINICVDKMNNL